MSVKTLNTQAPGYLSSPSSIYSSLMDYINAMNTAANALGIKLTVTVIN